MKLRREKLFFTERGLRGAGFKDSEVHPSLFCRETNVRWRWCGRTREAERGCLHLLFDFGTRKQVLEAKETGVVSAKQIVIICSNTHTHTHTM